MMGKAALGGAAAAAAAGIYIYRSRVDFDGKHGPAATEHKASPGDADYDEQMARLWGGPPPKYFYKCFEEWPSKYPAAAGGRGVALVTGGTGGIGFYVVKLLAQLGYEVIVPGREGFEDEEAGVQAAVAKAVPGAKVIVPSVKMNLGDFASVRSFAAEVREKYGRLDLLCLNAGRGGAKGDPRDVTKDGHEAIMQVNATAHFLLTLELLPLLRASPAARVVSQSSGARLFAFGVREKMTDIDATDPAKFVAWDQYCLSKAANALFTKALNERMVEQGADNVVALVCDPGLASTGVNFQHDLSKSLLGVIPGLTKLLHHVAGHHAADGALTMVLAAVDPAATRNDWYTTANGPFGPPKRGDPRKDGEPKKDPLNDDVYPRAVRENFWEQASTHTMAKL